MPPKKRLAVIGLGMAVTPHAKGLKDLRERVEVVHAYSRTAERRDAFQQTFGFPVTDDLDRIVADASLDAVMILTPPNTHLDLAERFAAAGRHILLEKPVERSTERATRLVEAADAAGIKLGIVFQNRFREASEHLRHKLADGALGDLVAANLTTAWWRPQTYYDEPGRGTLARDGGGVLITQAIHGLDLLLSLTGPVAEVSAIAGTTPVHRMETEDFVGAGLRYANGALGALVATTAQCPGFPEQFDLIGTKGAARLGGGVVTIDYHDGRTETVGEEQATGGGAGPMAFAHDYHRAVLVDFLDAIDADREPRITGHQALRVHHLIDALLQSSEQGRRVAVPAA